MKFLKLLPAAILAVGVIAVPAAASASPLPAGVPVPKTHLPGLTNPGPGAVATNTLYSANWAGYVDLPKSGKTFTDVGTTFYIPRLSASQKSACVAAAAGTPNDTSYAAYWAGLDGANNGTVEQEGVAQYCQGDGTTGLYAWYEMYPANPVPFFGAVNPGDKIVVVTLYTGGKYNLYLHDVTNGFHFNVKESGNGKRASAEVITEDPGDGNPSVWHLADYGSAKYTNSIVKGSGVTGPLSKSSAWSSFRVNEVDNNGHTMQTTKDLNRSGNGFADDFNWSH